VLHDWADRQAQRILANTAAAGSGARLLVLDFVVPPGDAPHMSKISDLNMLAMMGGKERTGPEWPELLEGRASPASKYTRPAHHSQSSRQQRHNRANQRISGWYVHRNDPRSTSLSSSYSAGRMWIVLRPGLLGFGSAGA
jgi:hypothetical protein